MKGDFYAIRPRVVDRSILINSTEKQLWYRISDNIDNAGCCKLTNAELGKELHVSAVMISNMLSHMAKEGYVAITYETRNHARRLYPIYPGEHDVPLPSQKQIQLRKDKLEEALQKGIRIDDEYFFALANKIRYSPILDEVKDNTTQFCLSLEQIKFLAKFMELFPDKEIDMQIASVVKPIDYDKLLDEIKNSDFLRTCNNLSLKWLIGNYEDVVEKKKHAPFNDKKKIFVLKGRDYSREELNALIPSVDEIEI